MLTFPSASSQTHIEMIFGSTSERHRGVFRAPLFVCECACPLFAVQAQVTDSMWRRVSLCLFVWNRTAGCECPHAVLFSPRLAFVQKLLRLFSQCQHLCYLHKRVCVWGFAIFVGNTCKTQKPCIVEAYLIMPMKKTVHKRSKLRFITMLKL